MAAEFHPAQRSLAPPDLWGKKWGMADALQRGAYQVFDSTKTKKKGSRGYSKVKGRIDYRIVPEKSEVNKKVYNNNRK
ncbi:hypothetical protein DUI87_14672 [Hirundo rustica rustica]|uniref:Uncharacterized protein n=1 Tax=Hirundo rustica rustica TaxID=333673 RepID=A0A3M0K5M8_HIRRU|nr:hypothetical protein DUI87_14672 [Hirundo rustica rustica]